MSFNKKRIDVSCGSIRSGTMEANTLLHFLQEVLKNMPVDWRNLTTHRLDLYNEEQAKTEFLEGIDKLFKASDVSADALKKLPTAYDYIRLGHPLSCVLEWGVAKLNNLKPEQVISFSSQMMPILAVLRKNLLDHKNTQILYREALPNGFDAALLRSVYGYQFELKRIENTATIEAYEGSTLFISQEKEIQAVDCAPNIDFWVSCYESLGSCIQVQGQENAAYIGAIQHVRRREAIAMTPSDCYAALGLLTNTKLNNTDTKQLQASKKQVVEQIQTISGSNTKPLLSSCGLSIQYAILMGLIDQSLTEHPGKAIKIIVPPNCYGGTNDQARRIAVCIEQVAIVDLLVDAGNDMVQSIDGILATIASEDAVPLIIAEIPTNPRVEVPDLNKLKEVLSRERETANGTIAIDPVFILDQTFCPNVHFLGAGAILASIRTIAYVSGSKFPSGGKCTAGYCIGNKKTEDLIEAIELHLKLCDNWATHLQIEILAEHIPSMNQRIADAYTNTRAFVNHIKETLPDAKINFVSEELAQRGFTPSVFSLDLPTKGNTAEERETYKRAQNHRLIELMISDIPEESKHCVSYGQLKGCYWTIPATSTQGTTKEGDKDYIARVSLAPDIDLELHKEIFTKFVSSL